MEDIKLLLKSYQYIVSEYVERASRLLNCDEMKEIGMNYWKMINDMPKEKMNVFRIFTEDYYLEKFHDKMISFFLDPKEKHREGSVFLFEFIDFLNRNFKTEDKKILKSHYTSSIVETQHDNIDILIKSNNSHHCIIIEDKLYNADDQPRQLPRYYDSMKNEGFTVDAIVYIPLDINKHPDEHDWSEMDKKHVNDLLCEVPGFKRNGVCLVDGWLVPCSQRTSNIDCMSTLRQYADLIKYLNYDIMDNEILGEFYNALQKDKSLKTAQAISNMLPKLPAYMTSRIMHELKKIELPNGMKVWQWDKHFDHCGIMYETEETWYKIDIHTCETRYTIKVLEHVKDGNGRALDRIKDMQSLKTFNLVDNVYVNDRFSFYEEEEVLMCVKAIIPELHERLKDIAPCNV